MSVHHNITVSQYHNITTSQYYNINTQWTRVGENNGPLRFVRRHGWRTQARLDQFFLLQPEQIKLTLFLPQKKMKKVGIGGKAPPAASTASKWLGRSPPASHRD